MGSPVRKRCFYFVIGAVLFAGVFCLLRIPAADDSFAESPEFKVAAVQVNNDVLPIPPMSDYRMTEVAYAPHDSKCFTQGIEFLTNSIIAVSCGLYRQSRVYLADVKNGTVLVQQHLPAKYFAEGLTILRSSKRLLLLTWKEKEILLLDPRNLKIRDAIPYPFDGWGAASFGRRSALNESLTRCLQGERCIVDLPDPTETPDQDAYLAAAYNVDAKLKTGGTSEETQNSALAEDDAGMARPISDASDPEVIVTTNGTEYLMHFELRGREMVLVHSVAVKIGGAPVRFLNEIERVDGRTVLANVWYDTRLLHVDIWSGEVLGVADLRTLVPGTPHADVLNGIAVRPSDRRHYEGLEMPVWVTGKLWSFLYRVQLST